MGIQQDIAEALGVSTSTVSRALRNHRSISATTRAKVTEAAVRLGYRHGAPPLEPQTDGLVRLCALCCGDFARPTVHNAVTLRIIDGMSAAARERRAIVHVECLTPDGLASLAHAGAWPPALAEGAVAGLALFSDVGHEALAALAGTFACVHLLPCRTSLALDRVTEDNVRSVDLLVEHLWSLGHRRIGFVDLAGPSPSARARFAGYVQALDDRGVDYDPRDARFLKKAERLSSAERVERAAAHVARRLGAGVTAWICTDDFIAYELMRALRTRGIQPPRDISITGFDCFDPPDDLPRATSIDGPFETLGRAAVAQLVRRVRDPGLPPSHTCFPGRLVAGASTAPPPRRPRASGGRS